MGYLLIKVANMVGSKKKAGMRKESPHCTIVQCKHKSLSAEDKEQKRLTYVPQYVLAKSYTVFVCISLYKSSVLMEYLLPQLVNILSNKHFINMINFNAK